VSAGEFVFVHAAKPLALLSASEPGPLRDFTEAEGRSYTETGVITVDGGGGQQASMIAGCFKFAAPESHLLFNYLPTVMRFQMGGPQSSPWMHGLFQLMWAEIAQGKLGSMTVIDRLAEVLLVHAMRNAFDEPTEGCGPNWLRALGDPQIGASLRDIHFAPGEDWTVERLAKGVGMSRSAYAARFRHLVGDTPFEHVTRWRMFRAAGMLTATSPKKLPDIAASVGYESESSFRKKFRQLMGDTPSSFRTRYMASLSER
jgi:AraC-like DNA-binding protein